MGHRALTACPGPPRLPAQGLHLLEKVGAQPGRGGGEVRGCKMRTVHESTPF